MLKPFSGEKKWFRRNGAHKGRFQENGGIYFRYWFRDPQKALPCALFDVFCVKIGARVSAVAFLKDPAPKKYRLLLC